jgi:hypothetical protein
MFLLGQGGNKMLSQLLSIEEKFLIANVTSANPILGDLEDADRGDGGSITPRTVGRQSIIDLTPEILPQTEQLLEAWKYALSTNNHQELEEIKNQLLATQEGLTKEQDKPANLLEPYSLKELELLQQQFNALIRTRNQLIEELQCLERGYAAYFEICKKSSQAPLIHIVPYQENLKIKTDFDKDTPCALQYKINALAFKPLIGTFLPKTILHPVEKFLFQRALALLDRVSVDLTEKTKYLNNVVCVDFFVRDENNMIKGREELAETHTVVLWKTSFKNATKYIIIDPSDVTFSIFLLGLLQHIAPPGCMISNFDVAGGVLYGPGQDKTGYNFPLELPRPRDCIDISVKIAFELNEQQKKSLPSYDFLSTITDPFDAIARMMTFTLTNQRAASIYGASFLNAFDRKPQSTNAGYRKQALQKQVDNHRPISPPKKK